MNGWFGLLAFVVSWLVAQLSKVILGLIEGHRQSKKMNLGEIIGYVTRSGGMPSGHSASMAGLTVYIGMASGLDSGLFALAVGVTLITLYDATHVRYAVGEQGKALNGLLKKDGQKPLPLVEGHTLAQVAVGTLIGVLIGVGIGILTKA